MATNILFIENSVSFTGAFKAALQQAKLLGDGRKILFLIPAESSNLQLLRDEGFSVYTLPMREINRSPVNLLLYFPALFINYFKVNKIVKRENCSYIIVNDFYNLLGAMTKIFGYRGKLITYVRLLPHTLPGILSKTWVRLAQRYSYRVIAVSDAVLQQLPTAQNTIRVYDPVIFPEKMVQQKPDDRQEIRLLYLSNYIKGKGQESALEAFAGAYKENTCLRLRFVGGDMGLKKNKLFKQQLQTETEKRSLSQVIQFSGFSDDIEKEIKAADIVLNFSEAESFSMTCAEASFYGRPVIATRSGGPEEIILHEKTGLLVKNRDVNEMTVAILLLASDKEKRIQYGIDGKKYVQEKFSISKFSEEMKEIIQ